jgi:hypothetical protein
MNPQGPQMHQIADWLQKLGLGQYAQLFAENDITFVILPDLTDQDLEKIGVASLGHRRQLLRAIAELKGAPELGTATAAPFAPHDTAERRQVTVMFSDLVGSTALSARMDPEDCVKSFQPIRNASLRTCDALADSLPSTWATVCSSISAIPKLTRTMQSEPCVQGWNWSLL